MNSNASTKTPTKDAAVTLDKLTAVMERNKQHQTPGMVHHAIAVAATAAAVPHAVAPTHDATDHQHAGGINSLGFVAQGRRGRPNACSIRISADDEARLHAIIRQGLALNEILTTSEAIKIALFDYDPRKLTPAAIHALRVKDGRINRSALLRHAV